MSSKVYPDADAALAGVRRVIVLMEHVSKNGAPKIVASCGLPLTGRNCVDRIITDLYVFDVDRKNGGLTLQRLAPDVNVETVKAQTGIGFHHG